jgi:protein-arginine kinase activator protein McsA
MTATTSNQVIETKICNRCGTKESYPTFIDGKEVHLSKLFINNITIKVFKPLYVEGHDKSDIFHIDLCDKCHEKFENFMKDNSNG